MEVEWENENPEQSYGMLYTLSNENKTVKKSLQTGTITLARDKNGRRDGLHKIRVVVDELPPKSDSYDGIGFMNSSYTLSNCALSSAHSICFHISGKITIDGNFLDQKEALKAGDVVLFILDCDVKKLTINVNDSDVRDVSLQDTTYHLACCFRSGGQITAEIVKKKTPILHAISATQSRIVSKLDIRGGFLMKSHSKLDGFFAVYPELGPSYKVFFPSNLSYCARQFEEAKMRSNFNLKDLDSAIEKVPSYDLFVTSLDSHVTQSHIFESIVEHSSSVSAVIVAASALR